MQHIPLTTLYAIRIIGTNRTKIGQARGVRFAGQRRGFRTHQRRELCAVQARTYPKLANSLGSWRGWSTPRAPCDWHYKIVSVRLAGASLPSTRACRSALYNPPFWAFLRRGLSPLSRITVTAGWEEIMSSKKSASAGCRQPFGLVRNPAEVWIALHELQAIGIALQMGVLLAPHARTFKGERL